MGIMEPERQSMGLWLHFMADGMSPDRVGERALVWCRRAAVLAKQGLG